MADRPQGLTRRYSSRARRSPDVLDTIWELISVGAVEPVSCLSTGPWYSSGTALARRLVGARDGRLSPCEAKALSAMSQHNAELSRLAIAQAASIGKRVAAQAKHAIAEMTESRREELAAVGVGDERLQRLQDLSHEVLAEHVEREVRDNARHLLAHETAESHVYETHLRYVGPPARRAPRPRLRRTGRRTRSHRASPSRRSSARSGDSGDDGGGEPPAPALGRRHLQGCSR